MRTARSVVTLVAGLALLVPGTTPASADVVNQEYRITFEAPLPCLAYCSYWLDSIGFEACEEPFPPGAWDDRVVRAPAGADLLEYSIFPPVDWDSFICSKPASGNNGRLLASGANIIGDSCDGMLGPNDPTGNGCAERILLEVTGGTSYVLRAYNWSDLPTLTGKYKWLDTK